MMRFTLAGYGAWGRLHAQTLQRMPEAELCAVYCHGDASAAAAAAELPGVTVYRDFRRMLQEVPGEAVDIVVPNVLHADFACAALAADRHVFLEKPLATTVADCDRVIAAARSAGRVVAVNHELRVSQQWGAIRREIASGAIGRPRYASFTLFRHAFRSGSSGWRHDPARVGSWILEEPVHFFDLLMWYFAAVGEPVAVRARGNGPRAAEGMYENFSASMIYPEGEFITVSQSLGGFEHHCTLEIVGDAGGVRSWWAGATARTGTPSFATRISRRGGEPEALVAPHSGEVFELEEMLRAAIAGFRHNLAPVGAEEARRSIIACLAAEEACRTGDVIRLLF
jgi:myo-inositol 2-dehydrogenase/D-chiro-inositol 1-dehydrogenase